MTSHLTWRRRAKRAWLAFGGHKFIDPLPRNGDGFDPMAKSSEVTLLFHRLRTIPGWFTVDDTAHFHLVLEMQSRAGMRGDLLEIGCYFGRSTGAIVGHLRPGEKLIACDAFDQNATDDQYAEVPSVETFQRNLLLARPGLDLAQVEIHNCLSAQLKLSAGDSLRFAHVDGGHSVADALHDLELTYSRLQPGGVIVADDFHHPGWPGVSQAVEAFLAKHPDMVTLADLNRFGEVGRKLYLIRVPHESRH